jgi:GntR family transcriptional repressor for pyruvate dehydrogenase complex
LTEEILDKDITPNQTRQSLFETTVEWIEKQVSDERYSVGSKLPSQRVMCETLGVSRTILREALRAVESKGLISIFPGKGVYVRNPGYDTVSAPLRRLVDGGQVTFEDLLQARYFLEPGIAHLAAIKADDKIIQMLEADLEMMKSEVENGDSFIIADQNFHTHLAMATNNPVLLIMISSLAKNLVILRSTVYEATGAPNKAIQRHEEILEAIKVKNATEAYQSMERHLEDTEEYQRIVLMQQSLNNKI